MPYKDREKQKEYLKKHYVANKDLYLARSKIAKKKGKTLKRAFIRRYKRFCSCKRCGYDKSIDALEFHHIDPTKKDKEISRLLSGNWSLKRIKAEIRKCVVLCSNCHREVHNEIKRGIIHEWVLDSDNGSNSENR